MMLIVTLHSYAKDSVLEDVFILSYGTNVASSEQGPVSRICQLFFVFERSLLMLHLHVLWDPLMYSRNGILFYYHICIILVYLELFKGRYEKEHKFPDMKIDLFAWCHM
jgi:hypothetical protein